MPASSCTSTSRNSAGSTVPVIGSGPRSRADVDQRRGMGSRARLHRRRYPPRLRRSAPRRTRPPPPSGSSNEPSPGSPHVASRVRQVMSDNGAPYISTVWATWCATASHRAPPHPALPAPHQRQSRTVHPNHAARVGLRRHVPHLSAPSPCTPRLDRLLQPPTTPRRPRPQDTRQPPSRRLTNVRGNYS